MATSGDFEMAIDTEIGTWRPNGRRTCGAFV
jgi:hypothetical protein